MINGGRNYTTKPINVCKDPPDTLVTLTLKISSGKKAIKSWSDSVTMSLSNCDLNNSPQAATALANNHEQRRVYLSTTPGQTFFAATNFLIVKAIERLELEANFGRIIEKTRRN